VATGPGAGWQLFAKLLILRKPRGRSLLLCVNIGARAVVGVVPAVFPAQAQLFAKYEFCESSATETVFFWTIWFAIALR